ncbi:MAG: hypothetical protein J2P57_14375 [Acidimicrobiaceae bacterium]|nr:hypothetical protein [Acidimicrobiaceae bacterium]
MIASLNVARYHLVDRLTYLGLPWAILAFTFVINVIIAAAIPVKAGTPIHVGGLASFYFVLVAAGVLSTTRSLPFGLAVGVSRRSYWIGTTGLAVTLAAVYGLVLTLLQVVERATNGWGVKLYFFRVTYLLDGPWYQTWLTSFVGLAVVFVYGSWFGLMYRRWRVMGLAAFIACQVTLLLAGALIATWVDAWHSVGHFFTTLSASGLTGLLAALAAALFAGAFVTIRRVTV